MLYRGSPLEALQRVSEVLSLYWKLVTTSKVPLDWRCQQEYTELFTSTTDIPTESSTQYFTGGKLYVRSRSAISCVYLTCCDWTF